MYGSHAHIPSYHPSGVTGLTQFSSEDVTLWMRQQPKEALLCVDGKEKVRKPVDPPPIIQLTMAPRSDPPQHFLQSPYLFMCASLWLADRDEPWKGAPTKSLAGSMVSSLHRLKDIDNKDGAFFVFGDISVKVRGRFRLRFSLFDYQKSSNAAHYLGAVMSQPFTVDLQKDYKGLTESTYLSRAFSDQGVRLRLRKEPRTVIGNKRSYASVGPPPVDSPNKRLRVSNEDHHEDVSYAPTLPATYNTTPTLPATYNTAPALSSTYNTTPTLSTAYNMPTLSSTYSMAPYAAPDILSSQQLSHQQWSTPQQSYSHWYDNGQVP